MSVYKQSQQFELGRCERRELCERLAQGRQPAEAPGFKKNRLRKSLGLFSMLKTLGHK